MLSYHKSSFCAVGEAGRPVWKAYIQPKDEGGPYNITLQSGGCQLTISDILFGDVWFCSGQSNMVHLLNNVQIYILKYPLHFYCKIVILLIKFSDRRPSARVGSGRKLPKHSNLQKRPQLQRPSPGGPRRNFSKLGGPR